ncbi:MAG: restriction endonuclease subunit S [Clostridiaceae bacterium]|nr:restriction endonuclease subunit S [Clostridiaceae bacterium]
MKSDWEITPLSELCTKIGSGATPRGGKEAYKNNGISLIRSQNVLDFSFSFDGIAYIDNEQADKLNNVEVNENDVLINITGDSVARVCIVPKNALPARVNQHVAIIRSSPKKLDYRFLLYFLQQKKGDLLSLASAGATRNALTKGMLEQFAMWHPPFPEQKAIAETLSCLDDKIELNNRMNKNFEEQAQAIFKNWFVDFEPFQEGKFVDSELGRIPKEWRVGTLGELVETTIGGDWGKENPIGNYTREVYCLRGADIPEITKGSKGKMPVRYILPKNYANKQLCANDIVVEISGGSPTQSTGRVALITQSLLERYDKGMICTNFCRAIKPIREYSFFIFYIWQYLYNNGTMFSYENGTTGIKNFDINGFLSEELVVIPTLESVKAFTDLVTPFISENFSNGLQNQTLATIRDSLLPKLISGDLLVPFEV